MNSELPDEDRASRVRDAAERVLGQPRMFARHEVAPQAGFTLAEARRLWLALGFPTAADGDAAFTQADVDALQGIADLMASGRIDAPMAVSLTRAIGRSVDRLAAWQASLFLDVVLTEQGAPDLPVDDLEARLEEPLSSGVGGRDADETAASHLAGERLLEVADDLEPLIVYAWRRHLAAALSRLFSEGHEQAGGLRRTVGFADMVGFTSLVTRLSDQQLGRLVARFEALAADIVAAHGGHIVKTVGDEVFYYARSERAAVDIASDLVRTMDDDPAMPRIRVGLASGVVLSHLGDLFGTTVNRASRITEVARPDTIVVDDATARVLVDDRDYLVQRLEPRPLRGLGETGMWSLHRVGSSGVD